MQKREFMKTQTTYTIHLINDGEDNENFWCFLEAPEKLSGSNVYANSNTSISISPKYHGKNSFIIPVQYCFGAGGSNEAVGLDIEIASEDTKNVDLGQGVSAVYNNAPPNEGPTLMKFEGKVDANNLVFEVNHFDKTSNENNKWYSSATFGIHTHNGFIGMTWSPDPGTTITIKPKLTFYIATGNFASNTLVDFTSVSTDTAKIDLDSFLHNEATVTWTELGTWKVSPGAPSQVSRRRTVLA